MQLVHTRFARAPARGTSCEYGQGIGYPRLGLKRPSLVYLLLPPGREGLVKGRLVLSDRRPFLVYGGPPAIAVPYGKPSILIE
jgi:hypothetical protein